MSIQHCFNCDREIDTDFDVEHFDMCGKEEIETIAPYRGKRIYNKWYKEIWWWLQEKIAIDPSGDLVDRDALLKELTKYISENYQPKTTSTDIEEVTGKFITMTSDYYASHPKETWVMDYTTKVIDFFLPHLSNKSELKKEAVMGFVGFLSKQLLAVGGTWQELELKQKTLDKINKSAQQYLSSNEKEVSK